MFAYRHALFFVFKALLCLGFAAYASLHGQPQEAFTFLKVGLASFWIGTPIALVFDTYLARSTQ